jgi:hypothetical protein
MNQIGAKNLLPIYFILYTIGVEVLGNTNEEKYQEKMSGISKITFINIDLFDYFIEVLSH